MGEQGEIPTLYIEGCEFKGIESFEANNDAYEDYVKKNMKPIWSDDMRSVSFNLKFNKYIFYKLIGLWDWAIESCPNKRVAHLIKNGKNEKVKNKNFNRAIRIIGKYEECK